MRFSILSGLALFGLVVGQQSTSQFYDDAPKVTNGNSTVIPNRYIIEFDTAANLEKSSLKRSLTPHESVYSSLKARGLEFSIISEFTSDVFNGASIEVQPDTDLSTILSTEGVVNVLPVKIITLPNSPLPAKNDQWPSNARAGRPSSTTSAAPSVITSCRGRGKNKQCTTSTVQPPQPTTTANSYPTTGFSFNPLIQVDRVHATGNKGKGVQVAVVDSGVDYTLPALGGGFGPGYKIAGGYDFVGDSFTGSNTPQPDNDPYDGCLGHGTFVAGIIGANDNIYNATGVAPDATQYAYRAFSCSGASRNDIIIDAMMRAYNEGADVINLSLGEPSAWSEDALSVVAQRINRAGCLVVAAAGNGGAVGAFYPFAPATGNGPIGAGSFDSPTFPAYLATVSTGYGPIPYYDFQVFAPGTYGIGAASSDPNDPNWFCTPAAAGVDLTGKIAIARRGGCALETKASNAAAAGAVAILVVNADGQPPAYYSNFVIDFATISSADGEYLLSQILANNAITLTFAFTPAPQPVATGNLTSIFSCVGPTNDLLLGASILAPGTNLISTIPAPLGSWSISDGTSFSSPIVAGAAALYINAKGKNTSPRRVREAFQASGKLVPTSKTDTSLVTVARQGAGQLQVYDAIFGDVTISPTELLLNDTAYFDGSKSLTIKNNGNSWRQYRLSHFPAGTALTYGDGNQPNSNPVPQVGNAANVRFSQSSIWLWPGGSWSVTVRFTAPTGLNAQNIPVYSGFIQITGGSNTVQVPYLGVAAAMKSVQVIDGSSAVIGINTPTIFTPQGGVQDGPRTYSFQNGDSPTVLYRLTGGTPRISIDLISPSANLGFTPNYVSKRDSEGVTHFLESRRIQADDSTSTSTSISSLRSSSSSSGSIILDWWCQLTRNKGWGCQNQNDNQNTYNKVPIVGTIYADDYVPRNDQSQLVTQWNFATATFTNGTTVPNGTYKFLMRALKITGNSKKQEDYETWVSAQTFTIAQ